MLRVGSGLLISCIFFCGVTHLFAASDVDETLLQIALSIIALTSLATAAFFHRTQSLLAEIVGRIEILPRGEAQRAAKKAASAAEAELETYRQQTPLHEKVVTLIKVGQAAQAHATRDGHAAIEASVQGIRAEVEQRLTRFQNEARQLFRQSRIDIQPFLKHIETLRWL